MAQTTTKPIPTPNSGESRDDFMGRCISFIVNEGTPQEQSVAICSRQWDENKSMLDSIHAKKKALTNKQIIRK